VCDQGSLVGLCTHDDKSLCAAVVICSTLVNIQTQTHRQHFDQLIWTARNAQTRMHKQSNIVPQCTQKLRGLAELLQMTFKIIILLVFSMSALHKNFVTGNYGQGKVRWGKKGVIVWSNERERLWTVERFHLRQIKMETG